MFLWLSPTKGRASIRTSVVIVASGLLAIMLIIIIHDSSNSDGSSINGQKDTFIWSYMFQVLCDILSYSARLYFSNKTAPKISHPTGSFFFFF